MQFTDVIAQMGGFRSMAQELGLSEGQAASGAASLVPAILGGFRKKAQGDPAGADALGGELEQLGGADLLDDVLSPQPTHLDRGNEVLGRIFGSKDVSRAVAEDAASRSGLDTGVLKKMLPMVAMMVAGCMAKQRGAGASGSGSGALGSLLGGMTGGSPSGSAGGLSSLLDLGGDGNPLDDILQRVRPQKH